MMMRMMILGQRGIAPRLAATAILIAAFGFCCEAFSVAPQRRVLSSSSWSTSTSPATPSIQSRLMLAAEESSEAEEGGSNSNNDPAAAAVDEEEAAAAAAAEQQEEEAPPEDPELTALKEGIAELEDELKQARRKVADVSDRADDFTKSGYARKVAEMENMRRARSMLQSSNKYAATAGVLTEFLPVLDRLQALREQYDADEFGAKYSALAGGLRAAFTEMGVTEYTVNEGEPVDKSRVVVVDSEYSETVEKDTVLRPVAIGMELQGNVVRMAECVASLGSETSAEEEESGGEEEAAPEEGDESSM